MKLLKIPFEQILAILGAMACLVITILLWQEITAHQPMWPAPGLYFIEITVVCVASAGLLMRGGVLARALVWVSAGIVLVFSLLAVFSVGVYYFPVALLLIIVALAADIRTRQPMLGHVGLFFAGGILQAALILVTAYLFK